MLLLKNYNAVPLSHALQVGGVVRLSYWRQFGSVVIVNGAHELSW